MAVNVFVKQNELIVVELLELLVLLNEETFDVYKQFTRVVSELMTVQLIQNSEQMRNSTPVWFTLI
jgi:hypothetical protein